MKKQRLWIRIALFVLVAAAIVTGLLLHDRQQMEAARNATLAEPEGTIIWNMAAGYRVEVSELQTYPDDWNMDNYAADYLGFGGRIGAYSYNTTENKTIEDLPWEPVSYYGRDQLAGMPNAAALLYAYDQIVAGVSGNTEEISIYNGVDAITMEEVKMVLDLYRRDYAHHFWLGNRYSIGYSSVSCVSITLEYLLSGAELQEAREAFDEAADAILAGLTADMSEYERELYLHDILAGMITYTEGTHAHNAYGALVEGRAVCEGYAEALQYLLQRAGIQSFLAIGASLDPETGTSVGHEWNYVRIDGEYYHVDLTWNDQDENLYHAYFNQTDALIQEDHVMDAVAYTLPVCDATTAHYFSGEDTYLSSYTPSAVGQLLRNNGLTVHVYIPGSVDNFLSWYYANIRDIAIGAEIYGSFSYGYARLGRELILTIKTSCTHTNLTHHPETPASCISDGQKAYYVCACGKIFANRAATVEITDLEKWKAGEGKIAATGHHYKSVVTNPTCTAQGYTTHTCVCGDSYVDTYKQALGHGYGSWYETKAPTCTEKGQQKRDCSRCNHSETKSVNALGHSFTHYVSDGNATCTADGTKTAQCDRCDATHTVADAGSMTDHVFGEWITVKPATTTEEGKARRDCRNCNHYEEKTLPVLVGPGSTDNTLKSLTVSNATISPAFSPSVTNYTAEVPFEISKLDLTYQANDPKATVSVNNPTLTVDGTTNVTIKVTSESGSSKTYTITVKRAQDSNYQLSGNNNLSGITVDGFLLSPVFSAENTQYIVWLPYKTESITVRGTAADSKASVEVIGGSDLVAGQDNEIQVICTAENGEQKIYYVIAKRAAAHDGEVTPPQPEPETYTVLWVVDGNVTQETYEAGAIPSFSGSTDKAADDYFTYTFAGWNQEISAVNGDVTYVATYTKTAIEQPEKPDDKPTDDPTQPTTPAPTDPVGGQEENGEEKSGGMFILVATVLAVLCAAAGIAAGLVIGKKKK